jgi:hypothetical protein
MLTEADEADAAALLWCHRRNISVGYLSHLSGYSIDRIRRLIRIGEMLERTEGNRH